MARRKVWGPPLTFRLKIEDYDRLRALIPEDKQTDFLRNIILEKIAQLETENDSEETDSLAG